MKDSAFPNLRVVVNREGHQLQAGLDVDHVGGNGFDRADDRLRRRALGGLNLCESRGDAQAQRHRQGPEAANLPNQATHRCSAYKTLPSSSFSSVFKYIFPTTVSRSSVSAVWMTSLRGSSVGKIVLEPSKSL